MMQDHWFEIICLLLGNNGLFMFLNKISEKKSKTKATIKALCYNSLSDKLNGIISKGYATETDRRDVQILYTAYHNEGWNGDMDDRLKKVYALPFHPDQELTVIDDDK